MYRYHIICITGNIQTCNMCMYMYNIYIYVQYIYMYNIYIYVKKPVQIDNELANLTSPHCIAPPKFI